MVGAGKAGEAMARACVDCLREKIYRGMVICKQAPETPLYGNVHLLKGDHPVPGENSLRSTEMLVSLLEEVKPDDLVLCLISGGGSALMTQPADGVKLHDLQHLTQQLLGCGASIQEINTLRKHLDLIKGGGLARRVYPARLTGLILSDVVGDALDMIASGPTAGDPTTYQDACAILERYNLWEDTPLGIQKRLLEGCDGLHAETTKPGDACLENVQNIILASNRTAVQAASEAGRRFGYTVREYRCPVTGEAREAAVLLVGEFKKLLETEKRPFLLAAGGETTVTLHGKGKGGRNLEFALACVQELKGLENVRLITLATDGEDGTTGAAGAAVTGQTWEEARRKGLEPQAYLAQNDSYTFFRQLDRLIITGPTGTNVNDLVLLAAD